MPGSQVKDWNLYHKLRAEGHSEESAAKIANAQHAKKEGHMAAVHEGDREETGMKGGKYPVATKAQALSAIRLRHHGKGVSASAVLSHVARSKWGKDPEVKAALERARKRDAGGGGE